MRELDSASKDKRNLWREKFNLKTSEQSMIHNNERGYALKRFDSNV